MALMQSPSSPCAYWMLHIDRGPDWIFVRPLGIPDADREGTRFAESIWEAMRANLAHRLVLELDALPALRSHMIGQLVLLCKRIHSAGGTMRLVGLSPRNEEILRAVRLDSGLPCYEDRESAVLGIRKAK